MTVQNPLKSGNLCSGFGSLTQELNGKYIVKSHNILRSDFLKFSLKFQMKWVVKGFMGKYLIMFSRNSEDSVVENAISLFLVKYTYDAHFVIQHSFSERVEWAGIIHLATCKIASTQKLIKFYLL